MEMDESLERTRSDIELICAAFPDEVCLMTDEPPFIFTLSMSIDSDNDSRGSAHFTIEIPIGYPKVALRVVSVRGGSRVPKVILNTISDSIRTHAESNAEKNEECGLFVCSTACELWHRYWEEKAQSHLMREIVEPINNTSPIHEHQSISWISGKNIINDRKSVFQAHVCAVKSEATVQLALRTLIDNDNKIQRATHNMYAYRFSEKLENGCTLLHHDNDDDGEDQAGARLASLLDLRKEDGVLVVVSRWYGGVQLGPKRFAHISNVARELLDYCHTHKLL